MNYSEVIKYIQGLPPFVPIKRDDGRPLFDLETVSELAKRVGNPQDKIRCVHIAGTNGKGSTADFLSGIMIKSGYKTGLFTSPYLKDIREQTRINSKPIPEDKFSELFSRVIDKSEEMKAEGLKAPSEFEMDVVMSFLYFFECKCDICIIEAGLGGEFDATNIIKKPKLCVFSPISIDHTSVLGDNVQSIAIIKAGIIKQGCDCLTAKQDSMIFDILKERAQNNGVRLHMTALPENVKASLYGLSFKMKADKETIFLKTKVTGTYQAYNAALAVSAATILKKKGFDNIDIESLKEGLLSVKRPGRFDLISKHPVMIADGAHNAGGVEALLNSLKEIFPESYNKGKGFIFVVGVLADKDYNKMLKAVLPHIYKVYTVTPPNSRAMSAMELADIFIKNNACAIPEKTVNEAINSARDEAIHSGKPVVLFGSLYYMGDVVDL